MFSCDTRAMTDEPSASRVQTSDPPPAQTAGTSTPGAHLEYYKTTIQLLIHAENNTWIRLATFLTAAGFLIAAWNFRKSWDAAAVAIPLFGAFLAYNFAKTLYRSRLFVTRYVAHAQELERQLGGRGPVVSAQIGDHERWRSKIVAPRFGWLCFGLFVVLSGTSVWHWLLERHILQERSVPAWLRSAAAPPAAGSSRISLEPATAQPRDRDLLETGRDVIATAGGFSLSCLTAYFFWRRLRTKVLITCSTLLEQVGGGRVGNITLINRSDRPLTVFSLQGVDEGKVFEIEKFEPAQLLKPLESIFVTTSPFTAYSNYEVHHSKKPQYYAVLEDQAVKCELIDSPRVHSLKAFRGLEIVGKIAQRFNGKLYDERTKFAIIYMQGGARQTALVSKHGFIVGDWSFSATMFSKPDVETAQKLHACIQHSTLAKPLGRYAIFDFATNEYASLEWANAPA